MRHLNYTHLLYFWTVAREGSVTEAARVLHLTPQTVSGQIKQLEAQIGAPLFHRVGRGLAISETGRMVREYADEIFALGAELAQQVRTAEGAGARVLRIGLVESMAKLVAHGLMQPALTEAGDTRITCVEGDAEQLLGDLGAHRLDLVLSDHPVPAGMQVNAFNHRLGSSAVALFARGDLADRHGGDVPASLDAAPFLLPVAGTIMRRSLDDWFEAHGVRPRLVAEFDDGALLKAFGAAGNGVFPAPAAIAAEVERMYDVRRIATLDDVVDAYWAISPERRVTQPGVLRIIGRARERFGA